MSSDAEVIALMIGALKERDLNHLKWQLATSGLLIRFF